MFTAVDFLVSVVAVSANTATTIPNAVVVAMTDVAAVSFAVIVAFVCAFAAVPTAVALHDSSEVSYGVSHFFEKIKIRFEVSWVVDCRVF